MLWSSGHGQLVLGKLFEVRDVKIELVLEVVMVEVAAIEVELELVDLR